MGAMLTKTESKRGRSLSLVSRWQNLTGSQLIKEVWFTLDSSPSITKQNKNQEIWGLRAILMPRKTKWRPNKCTPHKNV